MDPITTAIVAALVAGATAGLTETTKQVIGDAYSALKAKINEKFGSESELVDAVARVETKPDSAGRKATLQEEIQAAKADQDQDLLALAKALSETIQNQTGQSVSIIATGGSAVAVGDGAKSVAKGGMLVEGGVGGDYIVGGGKKNK